MSECQHDLAERETMIADGYCPECMSQHIGRLRFALEEIAGAKCLTAKTGDEATKAWNHDKMIETAELALETE